MLVGKIDHNMGFRGKIAIFTNYHQKKFAIFLKSNDMIIFMKKLSVF
jgi:hypothetical protein